MLDSPLVARDGVAPSRLYLPKAPWPDLLSFLYHRFPHMDAQIIRERLARGDMVSSSGHVYDEHSAYPADSWLWYYREVEREVVVPFTLNILYHDDYLVVVDKPHFLASIPAGRFLQETALVRLRKQLDNPHLSPIHRLDRDTAGLLLFSTQKQYRGAYQSLFQSKAIHKTYECVAAYNPRLSLPLLRVSHIEKSAQYFTMQENPELAPNSQTEIELLRHQPSWGHYLLRPHSGKKHQLRVHMNGLGLPICHDEFYPQLLPARATDDFTKPLQLLARSIHFQDPLTQQERYFESGLVLQMVAQLWPEV